MDRISIKGQDMYVISVEEMQQSLDEHLLEKRKVKWMKNTLEHVKELLNTMTPEDLKALIDDSLIELENVK